MKYYIFPFFVKLSIQDKINFKVEYGIIYDKKISFISYLFQSQSLIKKYRNKIVS